MKPTGNILKATVTFTLLWCLVPVRGKSGSRSTGTQPVWSDLNGVSLLLFYCLCCVSRQTFDSLRRQHFQLRFAILLVQLYSSSFFLSPRTAGVPGFLPRDEEKVVTWMTTRNQVRRGWQVVDTLAATAGTISKNHNSPSQCIEKVLSVQNQ